MFTSNPHAALPVNSRARLPQRLREFSKLHKLDFKTLLSINDKTEKSQEETRILHFAPAETSGFNVCAGAGNCKKICLNWSGNPMFLDNKIPARMRRTLAFFSDKQIFLELIATSIFYTKFKIDWDFLACRLNGTSDIPWETIKFTVSPELSKFWQVKFGVYIVPTEYKSIVHMFAHYPELEVKFYDYSKIRRDWAECKAIGYHLTFSFDGHDNAQNDKIAREALSHGVNVAAAFNIKRGQPLPTEWMFQSTVREVLDGDLTDFRPSDKSGGHIVGLRFKLPHGVKWTESERNSFCMA